MAERKAPSSFSMAQRYSRVISLGAFGISNDRSSFSPSGFFVGSGKAMEIKAKVSGNRRVCPLPQAYCFFVDWRVLRIREILLVIGGVSSFTLRSSLGKVWPCVQAGCRSLEIHLDPPSPSFVQSTDSHF